jgi:hypothetical protein
MLLEKLSYVVSCALESQVLHQKLVRLDVFIVNGSVSAFSFAFSENFVLLVLLLLLEQCWLLLRQTQLQGVVVKGEVL